jgi:lipid-binding SYLF domain-containing protein
VHCDHSGRREVRFYIRRELWQRPGNLPYGAWLERPNLFVAIEGGSVGYQIGGSSTDIVMLFMNDRALQSLLGDKFKLGADASVAAGPVGRNAAAGTDVKMSAEILSYSRAKGVFAGVSLNGAVVQADKSGDEAMYGKDVSRRDIFHGKVAVPKSAAPLLHEIKGYVSEAKAK